MNNQFKMNNLKKSVLIFKLIGLVNETISNLFHIMTNPNSL